MYVVAVLLASSAKEDAFLREARIPGGAELPRWSSFVVERDIAMLSTRFVTAAEEPEGLEAALDDVYDELDADAPLRRGTQVSTALGWQTETRSDVHFHVEMPEKWLIFLHGYGGNVVSGCWVVAKAAAEAGWSTLCPSTLVAGRWEEAPGPTILRNAIDFAQAHGAQDYVIAGYSNGAIGAAQLVTGERADPAGLVLIAGFNSEVDASRITSPALVVAGGADARFSTEEFSAWASGIPRGQFVALPDADHMLLVKDREEVSTALSTFLERATGS